MANKQLIMAPFIKTQLCEDKDVEKQTDHFFNLLDLEYQPGTSVLDFYNQYRNLFVASLKQKGETIKWQNNRALLENEQLSPTFEDLILANVLDLVDMRLPELVREHYQHLMGRAKSLMDFKNEILANVPFMLKEEEGSQCTIFLREVDKIER